MNRRSLLMMLTLAPLAALAQEPNITGPQPELPKEKLTIITRDGVRHDFMVEMAITPQQQTVGLMFRPAVPPESGMLFDWGIPHDLQMWMRNTISPLDMVFINADGTIRSIAENTVPESSGGHRQPGAGAGDAGTASRDHGEAEHPSWRQGGAADFRQHRMRVASAAPHT